MSAFSFPTLWRKSFHLSIFVLVFLLWIQWPMRVFSGGNARLFNDIGQIVFAFFWVLAFAVACSTQSHLKLTSSVHSKPEHTIWRTTWSLMFTLPWAVFVIYSAWPLLWHSLQDNEKFPDTYSPGFYLIKLALVLLPVGLLSAGFRAFRKASHVES
jgi:TRAP-type mannitol/chloroaromatic compound transport system permease small subunit